MTIPLHLSPTATRDELLGRIALLDHHVFDLQSLLKAGEALFNELDVKSLCALVVAMVHERSGMDQIAVIIHNTEKKTMEVLGQRGLPPSVLEMSFIVEDGILWRLLRSGEPFTVVDSRGEPRFAEFFRNYNIEALGGIVWVPLVVADRVVGIISLGGQEKAASPLTDSFKFLEILGSLAAGALSTAMLYQSVAVARRDLNRSLHNLSMLFDITRALGAISDLTRLLRLILERAISAVDAQKGSLMLLDEVTETLMVRVVYGLPDKEVERKINDGELTCKRFKRGEGIAGKVLESGKTLRVNNVEFNESFTKKDGSHVNSILCVPLIVEEETIGVINITNKKNRETFAPEDVAILEALANQAAVAIARTRLYEAAISDSLTGLFVRRFTMHRYREEIRRSRRYDHPMSIIMCDIDHFKKVNDSYGHPVGDRVIAETARRLKKGMREGVDIVGRYGGEEFMVLLPQTDLAGAQLAAERVRVEIDSMVVDTGEGETFKVAMSFGCAQLCIEDERDTDEALLKRADDALYHAKKNGRNQVVAFEHGVNKRDRSTRDLPSAPSA